MSDQVADRFFAKVEKTDTCWLWTAAQINEGYGVFWVGSSGPKKQTYAHRWSYIHHVGPIPDGYEIDHVCHSSDESCPGGKECLHRQCVNPAHLEAVTPQENALRSKGITGENARKTHCPQGHPYSHRNRRQRFCRICKAQATARHRLKVQRKSRARDGTLA